jgi:exodeoxyribonuclease V alpha subunit
VRYVRDVEVGGSNPLTPTSPAGAPFRSEGGQPFRYFSLEPEPGVFVQSRTELMIYHALMRMRDELGKNKFDFLYEQYPVLADGTSLKIKTDFSVICGPSTWYWEHLGRLGNRVYERTWKTLKRPSYVNAGLETKLITSDELRGISPVKIDTIIKSIANGSVANEDSSQKYSLFHYSLR